MRLARALHPCPLSQSQPALLGSLANSIAVGDPPSPGRGADTSVFCDPPGPLPLFDISWSSALRHRDSFARPLGNPPVTQAGVNLCEAEAWGVPAAVREEWRSGACLLWTGLPKPFYRPNYSSVTENVSAVRTELARLASLSKITPWRGPGRRPRVVSPMGVVLKDGKTRMIVDMTASGVNANLHNPHFSMPSVESALNTIRPGDWLGKIDLTDAFLTFPLREDDRTLFGIQDPDTGLFWTYTCLPFGNSNSPYKYVTFSSYLLAALARCGLDELICFMDDHAIRGSSAFECELRMRVLLRFFRRMNIPVKHNKTLWPSRRMDFLGIIFDTVACTLELTPAKLASLRALVSSALVHYTSRTPVSGTFWQSLTGKLSFAGSVVRAGRTYVRRLWDLGSALVGKRRRACASFSLLISPTAAADLRWWHTALATHTGVRLWTPLSQEYFSLWRPGSMLPSQAAQTQTDACGSGWGFRCGSEYRRGHWTPAQARMSKNWKDLMTVQIACQWSGPYWAGKRVLLESDNTTAAGYANRGYGRISQLSDIARRIKQLEARYGFELVVIHLPGALNVIADGLSRFTIATSTQEWQLDPVVFHSLEADFGPHWADLMSDPEGRTAQLPVFFSEACSVFAVPLEGKNSYINPPWELIPDVLAYVLAAHARDPSTHATIVLPQFPDMPWWRLRRYFRTVRTFAKGTHLFRARDLTLQYPSPTLHSVGPTRWPVVVWRL